MRRSQFIKSSFAAAALSAIPFKQNPLALKQQQIIKPQRLKKGDAVGLISPGSFITEEELNTSVKNLTSLGFKVYYTNNILAKNGYLAGTDEQRTSDIHEMFSNKDVKGIICSRGGYGCARILPLLDYNLIRKNPKVISGYSDVTALLYAIFAKTGLVCFHGPVGISTFNDFSVDYFDKVVMHPSEQLQLNTVPEKNDEEYKPVTIISGSVKGILTGGNLSLVVSMIGTPYDIDTEGKIVFLEETGEEPYRIDRMLTQMIEAGKFNNAAGIVMGVFTKCVPEDSDTGILNSFSLKEVLFDRLSKLNIPVVYGLSFGHVVNKFTLPLGIMAQLNSISQTLTLMETAVS